MDQKSGGAVWLKSRRDDWARTGKGIGVGDGGDRFTCTK